MKRLSVLLLLVASLLMAVVPPAMAYNPQPTGATMWQTYTQKEYYWWEPQTQCRGGRQEAAQWYRRTETQRLYEEYYDADKPSDPHWWYATNTYNTLPIVEYPTGATRIQSCVM